MAAVTGPGESKPPSAELREVRAPSGVDGFDYLVEGGFPRGDLILLVGHPGSGKTIFSSQFLYEGATHGEPGVYVSFAENRQAFLRNMQRTHLDFEKLESDRLFKFVDLITVREGIEESLTNIMREISGLKAQRLVIDSFSAMAQAFPNKIDARIVMHTVLGKMTRFSGVTTLLISEKPLGSDSLGLGMEEFVSDGVVSLTQTTLSGHLFRHLDIFKMRGTNASRATHTYEIMERGLYVYPNIDVPTSSKIYDEKVSTGIDGLDRMLGGGPYKGSTIMVLGESGTGKTTSALQYMVRGAENREKILYISFEESEKELVRIGQAFGWPVRSYIDNGAVRIITCAPEPSKLDPLFDELRRVYQEFPPSMVIIDSLSSLSKAVPEDGFYEVVRKFASRCKDRGITFLATARTPQGGLPATFETSALADVILYFRQVESNSTLRRALIIFKARGLHHDTSIREFEISSKGGIVIENKFTDLEQILSGTPRTPSSARGWADAFTGDPKHRKVESKG